MSWDKMKGNSFVQFSFLGTSGAGLPCMAWAAYVDRNSGSFLVHAWRSYINTELHAKLWIVAPCFTACIDIRCSVVFHFSWNCQQTIPVQKKISLKIRCEPKSTQNQTDFQKCNDCYHFVKSLATSAVRLKVYFNSMKLHGYFSGPYLLWWISITKKEPICSWLNLGQILYRGGLYFLLHFKWKK